MILNWHHAYALIALGSGVYACAEQNRIHPGTEPFKMLLVFGLNALLWPLAMVIALLRGYVL